MKIKKFLTITALATSVNMTLGFVSRMFPQLQLLLLAPRVVLAIFLIMNYKESSKDRDTKNLFLSIGTGLSLGMFASYWDELTWLVPLYSESIASVSTLLVLVIIVIYFGVIYVKSGNSKAG